MQRISSRATFFYKRIFPIIWVGFLLVIIATALFFRSSSDLSSLLPSLIVPAVMIVIGYRIMKSLIFDLVDEVFDAGDALLVVNGGSKERIALSDIKNVNYVPYTSPPRVTLSIRCPSVFGSQITFCAPLRLVPFSTSPVIGDLIERVDRARERRV